MQVNQGFLLQYQLKVLWDAKAKNGELWSASIPVYDPTKLSPWSRPDPTGFISLFDKGDFWAVALTSHHHGQHHYDDDKMPAMLAKFDKESGDAIGVPITVEVENGAYVEMTPLDQEHIQHLGDVMFNFIQRAMYQNGLVSLLPVSHELTATSGHPPLALRIALG